MNLPLVATLVSVTIALVGLPVTWANWRRNRSERSSGRFLRVSEYVHGEQARLHTVALSDGRSEWMYDADVPMLTQEGWILPTPRPVEDVRLDWKNGPPSDDRSGEARVRARRLLPWRTGTERYPTYSNALVQLTGRSQLYDGELYRPTAIEGVANMPPATSKGPPFSMS